MESNPVERWNSCRLLLLQTVFIIFCDSANIMMVPTNMNSHFLYFARLGEGLSHLGHKVELFAPSNGRVPSHLANENFTITQYDVRNAIPFCSTREASEAMVRFALSKWKFLEMTKFYSMMRKVSESTLSDCEAFMENEQLMNRIKRSNFQFAIMDPPGAECYYELPRSLGIKYASLSIVGKGWFYRLNRPSTFVPNELTFSERIKSFISELVLEMTIASRKENAHDAHLPSSYELVRNSSFWLLLEHLVLNGAKSSLPNTISIGDIMAGQPVDSLPSELAEFLNQLPDGGAIVVSFGSLFDYAAELFSETFCTAFKQLKYHVIWKLKNSSACGNLNNVKILPWIPQNDLLAHKNVRLLITHGGFNSMLEAVHHATPVIVFPIGSDQPGHANFAARKGFGIEMSLSDFTAEELVDNIRRIFEEPSFSNQARIASGILKDAENKPAERVSHLINHVIKYGDQHLRSDAFQLSTLEFLQSDIFCFLSTVLIVISITLICCITKLSRLCRSKVATIKRKRD